MPFFHVKYCNAFLVFGNRLAIHSKVFAKTRTVVLGHSPLQFATYEGRQCIQHLFSDHTLV